MGFRRSCLRIQSKLWYSAILPIGRDVELSGASGPISTHSNEGLQALVAYTWAHGVDFGSNGTALPLQRANADFDVRNDLQGRSEWDLPR